MKFNQGFIAATLNEAVDLTATRLAQNFALNNIATKGSCTLEEAENMYNLASRILSEGSEDLIPENLELPDATDDVDPIAAQDAAVDADVNAASGEAEDFDIADLEGIILPDSEGNQYIIQGGILTPYMEDDDSNLAAGEDDGDGDVDSDSEENIQESTGVATSDADVTPVTSAIEESEVFTKNSSIIQSLIKNTQFN